MQKSGAKFPSTPIIHQNNLTQIATNPIEVAPSALDYIIKRQLNRKHRG